MQAIQQRCRPKHQVLILKCYPRTTKGAVDVKPNSSELSYLLYYATSRRSKIQKVGNFLERKTASDVWRLRIGNVQVTLQILEALIEKNPKDLPLFAPNVLKILDLILRSTDITMVESSIPTFEAFCTHHDASTLLADQFYLAQFEAVVRHYATFASTRLPPGKTPPTAPVAMRWRQCGLEAIRAVASSDALSSIAGRQYDMMVPMILENLWTDNEDFLDVLQQRAEAEEQVDTDRFVKRRTSVATVRTADTAGDTNPIALSGTAMDVDKLAEEDIGVLAMQCLKQIYIAQSRALIHHATTALLEFVHDRIEQGESVVRSERAGGRDGGWIVKICNLLLRWAPVQERYIILTTATDVMSHTPLTDDNLEQHIAMTAMIGSMLRSDASLIGLSVMDVLLGFIQHIKKLVQMPGDPAAAAAAAASEGPLPGQPDLRSPTTLEAVKTVENASSKRKELLLRLQQCIGDLATHIYYADQIADMVAAILFRLKPARSNPSSSSPPGEKVDDAADASHPQRDRSKQQLPHSADSLFSLTVAKTAALRSVKAILLVANPRAKHSGSQSNTQTRNRVPLQVWEGTHWILRDTDGHVRKAYVDALLTWLERESKPSDQEVHEESILLSGATFNGNSSGSNRPTTRGGRDASAGTAIGSTVLAKRAVSNTNPRDLASSSGAGIGVNGSSVKVKVRRVFFLPLIHLAIYDNALQYVEYETDLVLLHVLLNRLADRLGINAVRYGLPMIFQLQEAIQDVETPQAKVRIGSLVHGYFWSLTDKFNFEASVVGRAIRNEITRRRTKHFWVEGIQVPPLMLELVGTPGMSRPQPRMPLHEIESEALLPFDDRISLVDCISTGYQEGPIGSPPQSPSTSPGRSGSISGGPGSYFHAFGGGSTAADSERELPLAMREEMLTDWSPESVAQMVQQQAGSKSVSLSGSRTGTYTANNTAAGRNRPATNANNTTPSNLANGLYFGSSNSLLPSTSQSQLRPKSQPARVQGGAATNNDNLAAPVAARHRKTSLRSGVSPSPGGSFASRGDGRGRDSGFVTSIDQLKMALTGATLSPGMGSGQHGGEPNGREDSSSESMASYDLSASEFSFNPQTQGQAAQQQPPVPQARKSSAASDGAGGPLSSNPSHSDVAQTGMASTDFDTVPPVPLLPFAMAHEQQAQQPQQPQQPLGSWSLDARPKSAAPSKAANSMGGVPRRNLKSRGGESILSSLINDDMQAPAVDLETMLKGIDSRGGDHGIGHVSRPPY